MTTQVSDEHLMRLIENAMAKATVLHQEAATEPFSLTIGGVTPRSTDTLYLTAMYDARWTHRLFLIVDSQLNQACDIQVIGAETHSPDAPGNHFTIGATRTVPARSKISIPINLDDNYHHFFGVTIKAAVAPTSGTVALRVGGQRSVGGGRE